MTRTHHMTWQTAADADPEDTPCRTWLEEAVTDRNKSQVNNLTSETKISVIHFQTDWALNLRQLFEGPAQFEKPGNITALQVILTWTSCLCKDRYEFILATVLHKALNKMPYRCDLIPSRQDEWNSMKNFALLAVFTMASMPSSSIQAFSMLVFRSVPDKSITILLTS